MSAVEGCHGAGVMCPHLRTVDQFRRGFTQLGRAMAGAGVLPEPGLVWFLSLHELGQLLQPSGC